MQQSSQISSLLKNLSKRGKKLVSQSRYNNLKDKGWIASYLFGSWLVLLCSRRRASEGRWRSRFRSLSLSLDCRSTSYIQRFPLLAGFLDPVFASDCAISVPELRANGNQTKHQFFFPLRINLNSCYDSGKRGMSFLSDSLKYFRFSFVFSSPWSKERTLWL